MTDPVDSTTNYGDPNAGWYDEQASADNTEIGDKCVEAYGAIRRDGSNITLNNGHTYLIQMEWSNAARRCAFA